MLSCCPGSGQVLCTVDGVCYQESVGESMDRDRHTIQLDAAVARAFGVSPDIALLPGGSDQKTYRSGDVVLRYLGDFAADEGNWNADLFDRLDHQGFRVAKPRRAADG